MKPYLIIGLSALAAALCGSAQGAVTVLGDTSAEACSKAAFHGDVGRTAVELCTNALQNPVLDRRDEAGTYINRGVIFMGRGDFNAARGDFERAIAVDPTLGEAWVNRGAVNIVDKRFQDGVSDISKGLTLGTEEPAKAYYNRAIAYEALDDETSAYHDYEQALVLQPGWDLPRNELLRFTVTRKP
jgi:tetratricopeptide (TPR) repeat protein